MALLDSMLAENFHAAYRQKRSGVLTAETATQTMRFCFQDGSPVAIDLGSPKDRLLAQTLREYNRLSDEQLQQVLSEFEAGRAAVADLAVAHNFSSEEEVGRSTQAMVEDGLCRFFAAKMSQVSFDDQKTIDGFDFDRQAFRLKIDAEVLLRTLESKVAEIRTIQQEFGDFSAIYSFNEDSPGSSQLAENEKQLLNFVDGKSPVYAIAVLARDSELNTARALSLLAGKKVIRRLTQGTGQVSDGASGLQRGVGAATTAPAPVTRNAPTRGEAAAAAIRQATPTMREFTPYQRTYVEEPRSRFMTVVLGLVLVLLCVVSVLVYQYNQRMREFAAAQQRLDETINHGDWFGARNQIEEARTQAGQDLSALQRVGEMEVRLRNGITAELTAIEKLSNEGEHREAATRIGRLPEDDKVAAMRQVIARNESASRRRAQDLADRVAMALDHDDGAVAANLIATAPIPAREKASAEEVIDRWRIGRLELANSSGAIYTKRLKALSKLRDSEPPQRLQGQIAVVETDLARQLTKLREQLAGVTTLLDKGDIDAGANEIERLGLGEQLEGTSLAPELASLRGRISAVREALAGLYKTVGDVLQVIDRPAALVAVSDQVKKLTNSPLVGVAPKATMCVNLLTEVGKIPLDQAPDAQAAAVDQLADQGGYDPVLAAALHKRAERLRGLEAIAATALELSRTLSRDGKLDSALETLNSLLAKPELRATAAHAGAMQDIDEIKAKLVRRESLKGQLTAAIARGDVPAGTALAREMGLKYLPLAIESLPPGAEVWQDGKQIGTAPMVLDISAADRIEATYELRADGYTPATATGAQAEAGWHLMVKLERHPALTASLGGLVTGHPIAVGNKVVVASRSNLAAVDTQGKTWLLPFEQSSVDSPVYAAATINGDELLLATRDQMALATSLVEGKRTVRRIPLAGRSDFPVALFHSALIADRRFLIIAGLDGILHATDDRDLQAGGWAGTGGAPFACGPVVLGDVVVGVRKDGTITRLQAEDGKPLAPEVLGEAIVAAWPTAKGVAGYLVKESFTYDGETVVRQPLPQAAADGAADVVITPINRVLVRSATGDRSWDDLGKLDRALSGTPLVWNGHAVLPLGNRFLVLGKRGFQLTSKTEFLSPVILGDRLVAITQDGQVQQFDP
jgi:hypothetical protein